MVKIYVINKGLVCMKDERNGAVCFGDRKYVRRSGWGLVGWIMGVSNVLTQHCVTECRVRLLSVADKFV